MRILPDEHLAIQGFALNILTFDKVFCSNVMSRGVKSERILKTLGFVVLKITNVPLNASKWSPAVSNSSVTVKAIAKQLQESTMEEQMAAEMV